MVKIIEVPTSNEQPLSKSKNLISAQGSWSNKYGLRETNCIIHLTDFYTVDRAIPRLNNWDLYYPVLLF